ncbi:Uncharacterized protein PFLU_2495 [Pseudomonas [fluorescens] SBW25]|uniref:Uncharacterized protein n=4 Tax=Pseudomonas fluorescens TaxID=294 RepID=C3K8R2_PSEFS|nr:Uncharacterized protein PFLU_2495 [Pseudomonas fluorescens SBW25]
MRVNTSSKRGIVSHKILVQLQRARRHGRQENNNFMIVNELCWFPIMPKLKKYIEATQKCEELTMQMVEDVGGIVFSVRALEHTFLLANLEVEKAAQLDVSDTNKTTSLPSYMLARELKKLNFSLEALKTSIKRNIGESLSYLNSLTANLEMEIPDDPDDPLWEAFRDYKKVLIKSVRTLKKLDDELFNAEISLVDES